MSLGLENPGLLSLAPLVGLPLLIHLIARPRPRPLAFPSLQLLEQAHRQTMNLRRPRHWLLLILRTLWVALLLSVFLQPKWYGHRPDETGSTARTLVVVLDATASMRAREGAQSRYARAVTETATLLRRLDAGDRANVIRVRNEPESFYSEPGVNRDYLIEQLRVRPCSREGGSLADALRLAGEQLADAPGERDVVVISDFQPREGDVPILLTAPPGIALGTLSVAGDTVPNQAVASIRCLPARPVFGRPFQLQVEVHNFADTAVRRPLSLRIGERHEQTAVDLPPRGRAVALFDLEMEAEDNLTATARLEPDAFPTDDARHMVLPFQPVLLAGVWGDGPTAQVWTRTLDALPGIRVFPVEDPEEVSSNIDLLLLDGWSGEGLEAVRSMVNSGRSLFIHPSEISPEMSEWLKLPEGELVASRLDPALGLRIADPWPEELSLFQDDSHGSPVRGLIRRHAMFPLPDESVGPILALENGETVWGRVAAEPRVMYWNLELDPEHSDVTAHWEWVPMFGEAVRHAFRASEDLSAFAGDRLPLALTGFETAPPRLETRDGDPVPVRVTDGVAAAADPLPPGLYAWRHGEAERATALRAVNLPLSESDLRTLPPDTREGGDAVELSRAEAWREAREGRPLWPWLMAAAFLFAGIEHLFTQREVRT